MQIDSNDFPEFENYVINKYNSTAINLLNNLNIDLNSNGTYNSGVIKNPSDNDLNNNNIKLKEENKIVSVKSENEKQN